MDRDLVAAITAGAAAVGGFELVFLGIVIATYQSFGGDVKRRILSRYVWSARGLVSGFLLSLATVALAVIWLLYGGGAGALYVSTVALFLFSLVVTSIASTFVTFGVLLRP
jgi:hypothetical protein